MRNSIRGVSPVVGLVLLIGIVAICSISLLLVGGQMMTDIEQQAEQERVEQSFIELSHTISSNRISKDIPKEMTLNAGERGAIAREATGSYQITVQNESSSQIIGDGTIGTVEYESDDGTTVAYEAGAVFRETGVQTQVISEPSFDYNHESNTLSLPVVTMTEGGELSSGDIVVDHQNVTSSSVNQVQNYRLYIEIESEYCHGWETYFSDQAGDTAIEEPCSEGTANTVTVRLGYDEIEDAFSESVSLPNGEDSISGGKKHPFNDVEKNRFHPLDETVDSLAEEGEDEFDGVDGELKDGEYYTERIDDESLSFDLSNGDAILVVNESIGEDSGTPDITVTDSGDGNQLRIYVRENVNMNNGGKIGPSSDSGGDAKTIQVYGTSNTTVTFDKGGPEFTGLLYVAGGKINFQASPTFTGSIIADSIHLESSIPNGVEPVDVDHSDIEVIPSGHEPAPQITYVNIVNHEIEIKNE